jgi:hypothetical protein
MRKHTRRPEKTEDKKKPAGSTAQRKDTPTSDNTSNQFLTLQQTVGNRAVEQLIHGSTKQPASESKALTTKSVNYSDEGNGPIIMKGPEGGGSGGGDAVATKAPQAKKKKAGVDSFKVKWSENPQSTPKNPRLRLDFKAKFKDDDEHDPALAEFRQNAGARLEVKDGPGKGLINDIPMRDDNYSRADDSFGRPKSDVNFESNDNPGVRDEAGITKDSDIDFVFTAEQMIIDTSQGNKVLEKVGPKTGRITGKHPRKFDIPSNC